MKDYLKEYLRSYDWDPSKSMLRAIEARLLCPIELKMPILDIGCGDGTFASVALPGLRAVGFDRVFRAVSQAKRARFYTGLAVCDAARVAIKDASFNSVLINSFLEHITDTDLEGVVREAHRVLREKGRAVVTLNNASFGDADPIIESLKRVGLDGAAAAWRKRRDRRLALVSLKDHSFWSELFQRAGFRLIESRAYLSSDSERRFFLWVYLQYFGIGRINIGAIVRIISRGLTRVGIEAHRTALASIFGRILRKDYCADPERGSCSFFVLEKCEKG